MIARRSYLGRAVQLLPFPPLTAATLTTLSSGLRERSNGARKLVLGTVLLVLCCGVVGGDGGGNVVFTKFYHIITRITIVVQ